MQEQENTEKVSRSYGDDAQPEEPFAKQDSVLTRTGGTTLLALLGWRCGMAAVPPLPGMLLKIHSWAIDDHVLLPSISMDPVHRNRWILVCRPSLHPLPPKDQGCGWKKKTLFRLFALLNCIDQQMNCSGRDRQHRVRRTF